MWEIVSVCECLDGRMVLRSVYYECRRNNWITWFIPSARVWTHRGRSSGCVCEPGYQVIPMTRRPGGFFAQPEHCQKLLLDVGSLQGPKDSCTSRADIC